MVSTWSSLIPEAARLELPCRDAPIPSCTLQGGAVAEDAQLGQEKRAVDESLQPLPLHLKQDSADGLHKLSEWKLSFVFIYLMW